jgi:hypothetical protein
MRKTSEPRSKATSPDPDAQAEEREAALRAAMQESMDRFGETYRLLATEALSDDPNP